MMLLFFLNIVCWVWVLSVMFVGRRVRRSAMNHERLTVCLLSPPSFRKWKKWENVGKYILFTRLYVLARRTSITNTIEYDLSSDCKLKAKCLLKQGIRAMTVIKLNATFLVQLTGENKTFSCICRLDYTHSPHYFTSISHYSNMMQSVTWPAKSTAFFAFNMSFFQSNPYYQKLH